MKFLMVVLMVLFGFPHLMSQDTMSDSPHPFSDISEHPESFTNENLLARMIEGLGFRFYWATEGLRGNDLSFRPGLEARSTEETIDHILDLSIVILNCIKNRPNFRGDDNDKPRGFEARRKATLDNLYKAKNLLLSGDTVVEEMNLIFPGQNGTRQLPVWYLINGPIADAIWHSGQIASFRRSSGNPIQSNISFMMGLEMRD